MGSQELIVQEHKDVESIKNLLDKAFEFADNAQSKNTKKVYGYGWKSFSDWCYSKGIDPYKVEGKESVVGIYIADKADKKELKVDSIACYLAAIRSHYQDRKIVINLQHPAIQKVLKGVRNTMHTRPVRKEPLLTEDIRKIVNQISIGTEEKPHLQGIRDNALILLGFAGAFRRSELVGLNFEDLKETRNGFEVLLRKSKTDQEGEGQVKAIPYGANPKTCPVRAIQDWLKASGIKEGALFRAINRHNQIQQNALTGHAIALIIKRYAVNLGDSTTFSGHSLRAGFVTSAAKNKVPEHLIMQQTGHKNSDTLKRYIRLGLQFEENAATQVGL